MDFDAGVLFIDMLVEVGFDDTVVVDAESFTEGILCNLKPAVNISPESRSKVESDREGKPLRLEACE